MQQGQPSSSSSSSLGTTGSGEKAPSSSTSSNSPTTKGIPRRNSLGRLDFQYDSFPSKITRLLVVSNRLPLTYAAGDPKKGEPEYVLKPSSGGLIAGLQGVSIPFTWIGWLGFGTGALSPEAQQRLSAQVQRDYGYIPVFLPEDIAADYYNVYSNQMLWPVCHYQKQNIQAADPKVWASYQVANRAFAKVVLENYRPGDAVWVHDYLLLLVPSFLREENPNMVVGFFLHIPFPSSEVFRSIPQRKEILDSLLDANLVGFHAFDFARHFVSSCQRLLIDAESVSEGVLSRGRLTRVETIPIGIDPNKWLRQLEQDETKEHIANLLAEFDKKVIVFGCDRVDYTKGLPLKLLAVEQLLKDHPEMRERFVLLQVGVPSRQDVQEYQELVRDVNMLVGRINAEYGMLHHAPIRYINRSVDAAYLAALYAVSDACLVTSIRDGMNLVALEYVACQQGHFGALVLSEFAGAASSLPGSYIINPWNVAETAEVLYNALTASLEERRMKHQRNFEIVTRTNTSQKWASNFVEGLEKAYQASRMVLGDKERLGRTECVELFSNAQGKRLFFLDYDGTLTPIVRQPVYARPSKELLAILRRLCQQPNTFVYLVSGRDRTDMLRWFGELPIGLVAEHGMVVRHPDSTDFKMLIDAPDLSWMEPLGQIMKHVSERTPGSLVEVKTSSISFHYRECPVEFGERQANDLRCTLMSRANTLPVDIITGKKVVEVRCKGVSKGSMVRKLLYLLCYPDSGVTSEAPASMSQVDSAIQALPGVGFVLCAGDDRTDEDMFAVVNRLPPDRALSVIVGHHSSTARYRVSTPLQMQRILAGLADSVAAAGPPPTAPSTEGSTLSVGSPPVSLTPPLSKTAGLPAQAPSSLLTAGLARLPISPLAPSMIPDAESFGLEADTVRAPLPPSCRKQHESQQCQGKADSSQHEQHTQVMGGNS